MIERSNQRQNMNQCDVIFSSTGVNPMQDHLTIE